MFGSLYKESNSTILLFTQTLSQLISCFDSNDEIVRISVTIVSKSLICAIDNYSCIAFFCFSGDKSIYQVILRILQWSIGVVESRVRYFVKIQFNRLLFSALFL